MEVYERVRGVRMYMEGPADAKKGCRKKSHLTGGYIRSRAREREPASEPLVCGRDT